MGVPKFFKYISERYPCLSELIKEYQVPEFDNLYLDMNGIIHMCSHPDDSDAHFRITEEKIFQDIFHYIKILFRMIKPKKLFFMAIDGVAPRAKMNQQRGRRFRSAREAEQLEAKAKAKGEKLPDEDRFDSNCITPGTPFMARLHEQLKYFVVRQITNDRLWQDCKVVLSGHDTPGEGEHKIMDYIRYMKSQPDYDSNTRHCLYGLDADLIMLGLCTHEPHFSLLREEVQFGRKAHRVSVPEQINFYLLHLSLLREYLEQEFIGLKEGLPFDYDMEKIIDDWVLMGFLVGNDFIPNLPNLHITNGALPILYNAYMKVLPSLGGYINEAGSLNLKRFEKFMAALASIDMENFTETHADLKYFEGKTGRKLGATERTSYKPDGPDVVDAAVEVLEKKRAPMSADLAALIKSTDELFLEDPPDVWDSELSPDEPSTPDNILSESEDEDELFAAEFIQHKKDYYMNKLDYSKVTAEVLQSQAEGYVRAIQWNLNYYYNGVCSWSWFYPHHYAPYISDIVGFSDLKLEFDLGKPFLPFQQLLAVLPAASKRLLPEPYQRLMISDESPIVDYYPQDFRTDLNGKRQEWEAVVLIPFIDEESLLKAMEPLTKELTPDEIKRNTHGPMHEFQYYAVGMGIYRAPGHFENIKDHHALITPITMEEIRVPREKLVKGLCPGVKLDVYFPGFPTMKHLKYTSSLQKARVKVFEQPSRGDSVILQLISSDEKPNIEKLANDLIGKIIFVSWPHLVEAKVISVSNREYRYTESKSGENNYKIEENKGPLATQWFTSRKSIAESYKSRLGIEIGETEVIINAALMMGRKYVFDSTGEVTLEKQWCETTSAFALQACVTSIDVHVSSYTKYKSIQEVFLPFGTVFMLGIPHYGCMGEVINNNIPDKPGRVKVAMTVIPEPDLSPLTQLERELRVQYMTGGVAAQKLAISSHLLSRITGSIFVISGPKIDVVPDGVNKTNVGLNLKFNKRNEEIPGYTRKEGNTWLYSMKAVNLIKDFMQLCPELFDYLGRNASNDIFFEGEIYPTDANGENIKKIAAWLKEQPYSSLERQTVGTKTLEPELITHLERIVDSHYASVLKGKTVTMTVKPHVLFKPEIHISAILPDPTTTYYLYDRVVNVRDSYTVPLGLKGTVIAIHEPKGQPNDNQSEKSRDISYDIVFDQPFIGGMTLNCAPNRGYRMCAMNLLNISHGLRTEQMKTTGGPVQIQQQQQSRYRNTGGRNNQSAFASWNTSATRPLVPTHGLRPDPAQRSSIVEQKNALNQDAATVQISRQNELPMAFTRHAGPPIRTQSKPATAEFEAMWDDMHKKRDATKSEGSAGTSKENKSDKQSEDLIDLQNFLGQSASDEVQPSTNQNNPDSNKTQQSDNVQNSTDLLKMMLKISADSEKQSSSDASSTSSVQDFFQRAKETTTVSASLRLLNMFQSRGLGIPRYSYVPCPGPLVRAQISLPDGRLVMGAPAATNEQASEIAATLVLAELNKMGPPSTAVNASEHMRLGPPMMQPPLRMGQPVSAHQIRQMGPQHLMQGAPLQYQPPNRRQPMQQQPGMLPAPPQNWYQQNSQFGQPVFMPQFQQQQVSRNGNVRHDAQQKPQDSNKQPVAPSAAQGASPFVPLQAVKQQRNKNSTNKAGGTSKNTLKTDSPKKAAKNKSSTQTANDSMSQSDKSSNATCSSDQPKKKPIVKKVRKSRIAANFGVQKE